jgi:two-component system sensor histidine kinase/response regulator
VKPDKSQGQNTPPRKRILHKIILLFLLLIVSVIATAIYSTVLESRRADELFSQELTKKIEIAESVQNGQIKEMVIISGIVREQNQRYCNFLDYDNLSALTFMLKSISTIHGVDLAFVFDEYGDLVTTFPKGPVENDASIYKSLIANPRSRTDIEQISPKVLIDQIPSFAFRSSADQVLCFKSVVPLIHDTGESYGYVVLVRLINGNKELASNMAKLSKSGIIYFDIGGRAILSSFTASSIPLPSKGILKIGVVTYGTKGVNVTDSDGQKIGRLMVAEDKMPFLEKRRYLLIRNLTPFFSTAIICLFLFFLLRTRVFEKIGQLINVLREVSEGAGDLSIRLKTDKKKSPDKSIDEVEQMGIDFNQMMDKLENAYEQLAEAQREAERASVYKSQFLANMSHEIRTPMNAVIGFSDLLAETKLDENQMEYAKTIKSSGDALLTLINDILDFSKIEAGELQFEKTDFDPELIVYDVCDLIRPKIGTKPIEILCRIGDEVPSQVMGDPTRYRQVLTNLMGNAPKFTATGEIEISLYVEEETESSVKLHAAVRDTGIGIPSDKLALIFEPFQQADGSTTRNFGGTGLGLSICRKIANLMNGDVWAESAQYSKNDGESLSQGSTFHFTAWLEKGSVEEGPRIFSSVSLNGKRALIADDNRNNLEILEKLLKAVEMEVVPVSHSKEILTVLQKEHKSDARFDVAILDLQMPVTNGYDIAREIRKWERNTSKSDVVIGRLPLVALSSLMAKDALKCEEAGFDGFLSKPIRRNNLYMMLEGVLGKKSSDTQEERPKKQKIYTQYSLREDRKHSVRILLAEDNPVNQKLALIVLNKAGYQVEIVNNGKEAVERYAQSPEEFDLILMDIQMPELDGMKASRLIREKGFENVPIIAMTAHAMKGDREKCIDAGMNDYITKPIKREIVFEILGKWVLR